MQLLTFTIAGQPYAIPSKRVIEVLPLVPARPVPGMPGYVTGLFNYRGQLLPLIDLGTRIAAAPPPRRLSTRVIVVEFPAGAGVEAGAAGLARMGLVAENVISIRSVEGESSPLATMALPHAPYLGRILRLEERTGTDATTVQLIELERLLPEELLRGLFPHPATPSHAAE
jgi:chemotaxis-related protein WspB